MLLECTSNKYISTHSPASDQKGKSSSSSSQAPARSGEFYVVVMTAQHPPSQ